MRHGWKLGRKRHPMPYAATGVIVIAAVIVWLRPAAVPAALAGAPAGADFAAVRKVVEERCFMCHGAQVQMKNVRLDSAEGVRQHAQSIYQQVVVARLMPMNNATGITEAERALIAQWFQSGAPAQCQNRAGLDAAQRRAAIGATPLAGAVQSA
jgi:uncharacterized membrane protein